MNVLIFGKNGGVGSELVKLYSNDSVTPIGKEDINFNVNNDYEKLHYLLETIQPDVIINATGVFGNNDHSYDDIFNVNVKSNWNIISYYKKYPPNKIVKIIMLGSTAYEHGRKNYILYSSSKSALHNIFQGASELFHGSNVILGLIHPSKIDTKMIAAFSTNKKENCLSAETVAKDIKLFIDKLQDSCYIYLK